MTAFIQLRALLLCGLLGYPAVACGKGKEGVSVMVPEQASRGELVEMAVKVRPSGRQLDYQQREMLDRWSTLNETQQRIILALLEPM